MKRAYLSLTYLVLLLLLRTTIIQGQTNHNSMDPASESVGYSHFFYQRPEYPRDCQEAANQCSSANSSGISLVKPDGYPEPFEVYCDNSIDSGGWTVFYRRTNGSIDFYRTWNDYKDGFGFQRNEFWLGLEKLAFMTNQKKYEIRIDMENDAGSLFNIRYNYFRISDEWGDFRLSCIGQKCRTAATCRNETIAHGVVTKHNGQNFTQEARHGDFRNFTCDLGYRIVGEARSQCRDGEWTEEKPTCEGVTCDDVPEETGRDITYSDDSGDRKQHDSSLNVTCDGDMVRIGPDTSTCLNGVWDPPVAHCRENLALRRPAHQESTDHSGVASRAVDGNTDGFYHTGNSCTHSSYDRNPWWYVDLGSSYLIRDIIIYSRQDSGLHTRLLDAKVRVGDNYGSNVVQNELVYTVNDTSSNPIRIELNPAVEGRFVSVSELRQGVPLTLCEVQVFQ